eukprot:sb/3463894/
MEDRREDETVEMKNALLIMNKECQELKMENSHLKEQQNGIKSETMRLEARETALIQHCLKQLSDTMSQIGKLEVAAEQKSEEIVLLKRDLSDVTSSLTELTKRHVQLIDDNNELRMQVQTMREEQKVASTHLVNLQKKYEECLAMLEDNRKSVVPSPAPGTPNFVHETPCQPTPSIMNELEDAIISDLQQQRRRGRFSRTRARIAHHKEQRAALDTTTEESDNKDSGVKSEDSEDTDRDGGNLPFTPAHGTTRDGKRKLRRPTSSSATASRDALHELMADNDVTPSHHGSLHSVNSDTNITSISESWQSEPAGSGISGGGRLYGTNKLKMVKPLEGSMTLLQWKLLAMKQTGSSLLNAEERPGVVQRNTVSSAVPETEGIGVRYRYFSGLGDLIPPGNNGIISKGALSRNSVVSRNSMMQTPLSTPAKPSYQTPTAAATPQMGGQQGTSDSVNDLFAYLSTKYDVPKTETTEADTTPKASDQHTPVNRKDSSDPPFVVKKSPTPTAGLGRLFGWS